MLWAQAQVMLDIPSTIRCSSNHTQQQCWTGRSGAPGGCLGAATQVGETERDANEGVPWA